MSAHRRLIDELREHALVIGEVTLTSGAKAQYYVDAKRAILRPAGFAALAELVASYARQWEATAVGGLTLGADPIACAISYASALAGAPVRAFTVRKEPKSHGTGQLIEGPFRAGDRVAVVEDVITTGASALRAAEAVRGAGGQVVGVLALVDREEGGRETLERAGFEVRSLTRARDIVALMPG